MKRLRYLMWILTAFYFFLVIFFVVSMGDIDIHDYIVPSQMGLDEWISRFQAVTFSCLGISFLLGCIWCIMAWKFFEYSLEMLSTPFHRVVWTALLIACFVVSYIIMKVFIEMPISGTLFVYVFILIFSSILPYYFFTMTFTPSGAKFIPVLALQARRERW